MDEGGHGGACREPSSAQRAKAVTTSPLVAITAGARPGAWAGFGPAEDIEQIVQGVQNGSWVDGALGTAGAGLDALAAISDPVGALLQYGVAWMIDHVRPLSEALDWLAGDPGQISAHAQTWRNVATRMSDEADTLGRAVRWDVTEWMGAAGDAYRRHAGEKAQTLRALGRAAEGMALMTEGAGMLIGTVRIMVRDGIAMLVSRLVEYATELAGTLGLATPLVVEQVATLCASWATKITRWLKQLISSLHRLAHAMNELGERVGSLRQAGRTDTADLMGRKVTHPAARPRAPGRRPDDYLPAGDPIYHGTGSTAIGYDSATMRNFDVVQPEPGLHDVIVHGERNGTFRPGLVGEDGQNYPANFTDPNQIAAAVANNPNYTGGPVRLVSCHTGTVDPASGVPPAAQQVANSLGAPVTAPTNAVGVRTVGSGPQVPQIRSGGTWETFYPEVGGGAG